MHVCLHVYVGVYYLRAATEAERQKWVTALTLSKAKAIRNLESGMIYIQMIGNQKVLGLIASWVLDCNDSADEVAIIHISQLRVCSVWVD